MIHFQACHRRLHVTFHVVYSHYNYHYLPPSSPTRKNCFYGKNELFIGAVYIKGRGAVYIKGRGAVLYWADFMG